MQPIFPPAQLSPSIKVKCTSSHLGQEWMWNPNECTSPWEINTQPVSEPLEDEPFPDYFFTRAMKCSLCSCQNKYLILSPTFIWPSTSQLLLTILTILENTHCTNMTINVLTNEWPFTLYFNVILYNSIYIFWNSFSKERNVWGFLFTLLINLNPLSVH